MSYTIEDLEIAFKNFGIEKNTPIIMHSSLFTLGKLQDSKSKDIPEEILTFLSNYNFALPSFNYSFPKEKFIDLTQQNSLMGVLSNFAIKKGLDRSTHPIFSFVGTNSLIQSEYIEKNPFLSNSVYGRVTEQNGFILLLGVQLELATYIIYAEYQASVKYRFLKPFTGAVKLKNKTINDTFYHFALPLAENTQHNYKEFHEYLLEKKIAKKISIGKSYLYGFRTQDFINELTKYIENNHFKLLKNIPKHKYVFSDNKEVAYSW